MLTDNHYDQCIHTHSLSFSSQVVVGQTTRPQILTRHPCPEPTGSGKLTYHQQGLNKWKNKKLSYRWMTAPCVLSVVISPITMQQCRNYLYDKSWPDRWYEVGGLVGGNVSLTNRRRSSCVYHLYTDNLLWRNFLSPQCRNCSRDPDHAHLRNTHSSQD